jgi:hypothetical protein
MTMDTAPSRAVLTVQVDVDTQKQLLAFYGFAVSPTYEDQVVYRRALPRFAALFRELGLRATFFVIGDDLSREAPREVLCQLHEAGHEIANHSHTHAYDFVRLSHQQKYDEIGRADHAIERAIGRRPTGFRAPGYDVDRDVLDILIGLGYRYDSSVMPSLLNLPVKGGPALKSRRRNVSGYGSAALCLAPNRPYRPDRQTLWRRNRRTPLWEIPVSCVPYVRLPFYANFNLFAGSALFRASSALAAGKPCNYVFHAVEMLAPEEIDPRLHRHPNARLPLAQKVACCRRFLHRLMQGRRVMLTREAVAELEGGMQPPAPQSMAIEHTPQRSDPS